MQPQPVRLRADSDKSGPSTGCAAATLFLGLFALTAGAVLLSLQRTDWAKPYAFRIGAPLTFGGLLVTLIGTGCCYITRESRQRAPQLPVPGSRAPAEPVAPQPIADPEQPAQPAAPQPMQRPTIPSTPPLPDNLSPRQLNTLLRARVEALHQVRQERLNQLAGSSTRIEQVGTETRVTRTETCSAAMRYALTKVFANGQLQIPALGYHSVMPESENSALQSALNQLRQQFVTSIDTEIAYQRLQPGADLIEASKVVVQQLLHLITVVDSIPELPAAAPVVPPRAPSPVVQPPVPSPAQQLNQKLRQQVQQVHMHREAQLGLASQSLNKGAIGDFLWRATGTEAALKPLNDKMPELGTAPQSDQLDADNQRLTRELAQLRQAIQEAIARYEHTQRTTHDTNTRQRAMHSEAALKLMSQQIPEL